MAAEIQTSALGFLNLCLGPFLPQKSLDLIRLALIKRARKGKSSDPALSEAILVREVLDTLKKRRKAVLAHLDSSDPYDPALLELLKLPADDAILLCSEGLFPMPLGLLALVLKAPEMSLAHRQAQLLSRHPELPGRLRAIEESGLTRIPGAGRRRRGPLSRFQSLPLGIRLMLETSLVLGFLLALLWVIPEVRNLYESSIQKRINEYLVESALIDSPAPEGTSKSPRAPLEPESASDGRDSPEVKSSSEPPSTKRQPKVNEGETWRFSFTGSATTEMEDGILEILQKLRIHGAKPLNVPGGIQFDFNLETGKLLDFKARIEDLISSLQRKGAGAQASALAYANLSWYKKKNMGARPIPANHVQVILWISTL